MTHRFNSSFQSLLVSALSLALIRCGAPSNNDAGPTPDGSSPADVTSDRTAHEDSATADASTADSATLDAQTPSDTGVRPDATSADSGVSTGRVGVFVAQGHVARTTISCDDGRTWVANRSDNDALRCFTAGVDCDHNGGRAMGVTSIDGAIFASWGWGMANSVRRTTDGMRWDRTLDRTIFSGIESASGRVVAIANQSQLTTDLGARWTMSTPLGFVGHIRATGVIGTTQRRFVAAGGENGATVGSVMLSDDGMTWRRPATIAPECGQGVVADGIGSGGDGAGIAVITHESGLVCTSRDNGQTWTTARADGISFEGTVIHTGTEFVTWGRSMTMGLVHLRSTDGARWTATATSATNADGSRATTPRINAAARSPSGTFVTVHGEWDNWYDRQVFYRSTDGVRWQALPRTAFVGSHPIRFFTYAEIPRGGACP
ncbi:MAG: hypothetical protein JNK05_07130 [Myxococcales bacterium]|nr:hypothetical protein [Myxococcales bacterium]